MAQQVHSHAMPGEFHRSGGARTGKSPRLNALTHPIRPKAVNIQSHNYRGD